MADKKIKIAIEGDASKLEQSVNQSGSRLQWLKAQFALLLTQVQSAAGGFWQFSQSTVAALLSASQHVYALTASVLGLGAQLGRITANYLGLSIGLDTNNTKLELARKALENFHYETRISLGFLTTLAALLKNLPFPLEPLTRFINLLAKMDIVLGMGRGKKIDLFDAFNAGIDRAQTALSNLNQTVDVFADHVKSRLVKLAGVLSVEGLVQWRGVQFEAQFANVRKVVEGTAAQLRSLRKELLDMSLTVSTPLDALTAIAAIGGQMGIAAKQLKPFVDLVSKIGVAFGMLPELAAEAVGKLRAIYNLGMEEIKAFADQINYVADNAKGAVSESGLLAVVNYAGETAKGFGLLRTELLGLAGALLQTGKEPEKVGTALRNLLVSLQSAPEGTKGFQEALQQMGYSADTLANDIAKHPKKTLDDFLLTLKQFDNQSQTTLLAKMFGKGEDTEIIKTLISQVDEYQRLVSVAQSQDAIGSMDKTFAEKEKTAMAALDKLKNSLYALAIVASDIFLPAINGVANALTGLVAWLKQLNEEYPNTLAFMRVTAIFGIIGTVIRLTFGPATLAIVRTFITTLTAYFSSGLVPGIRAALLAIPALFGAVFQTAIGRFIGGATVLFGALQLLPPIIAGLSTALAFLATNPIALLGAAIVLLVARMTVSATVLAGLSSSIALLGRGLLTLVGGPIGLAVSALAFLLIKFYEFKDSVIEIAGVSATGSEVISAAWTLIKRKITDAIDAVGGVFNRFGQWLAGLIGVNEQSFNAITDKIKRFVTESPNFFKGWLNVLIGAFVALKDNAEIRLQQLNDVLKLKFKHAVDLAKAAGQDIASALNGEFGTRNIDKQLNINNQETGQQQAKANQDASNATKQAFSTDYVSEALQALNNTLDEAGKEIAQEIKRERADGQKPAPTPEARANSGAGLSLSNADTASTGAGAKKALQADLDAQLAVIKTKQTALKDAHDLELKQLDTALNEQKLKLEQQVVDELITEQQKNEQLLALKKDTDAKNIELQRQFIGQNYKLEQASIAAEMTAKRKQAPGHYAELTAAAEAKYHLPPGLVQAVMQVESKGNPNAVSPAGAQGLMQLMPATARGLGITDVFDPKQNIEGGAKLLRELLDTFNQDVEKALAAYNSSPSKVKKAQGDLTQLPKETQNYVPKVLGEMKNPSGGTADEKAEYNATIKTLEQKLIALEQEKTTKLKALGIEEQNNTLEQNNEALSNKKQRNDEEKALTTQRLDEAQQASLNELSLKQQVLQQDLDLGRITEQERLDQLKQLAAEELALKLKTLEEKRKLLGLDKLALAENLAEQHQLIAEFNQQFNDIDFQGIKELKNQFNGLFEPLQSAVDQSVSGIITGQQTIADAARNTAQSIVLSYIQQSIKTRMIKMQDWLFEHTGMAKMLADKKHFDLLELAWDSLMWVRQRVAKAAQWAWEISGLAGLEARKRAIKNAAAAWDNLMQLRHKIRLGALWLWERLGFAEKEAEKVAVKSTAEAAQTGAQAAGDLARTTSTIAAGETKKQVDSQTASQSIFGKAYDAAAGVYTSLADIPYVGWILAPIAAAATLALVLGWSSMVGSAKGGEWQVGQDGSPFILHEKESVLPAWAAEKWRNVVTKADQLANPADLVKQATGAISELVTGKPVIPPAVHQTIQQEMVNGALPAALPPAPPDIMQFIQQHGRAREQAHDSARKTQELQAMQTGAMVAANQSQEKVSHRHELHMHTVNFADLLRQNGKTLVKVLSDEHRKFNKIKS